MFLEETPAVLSLVKLCEDHGFSYRWISGQKHISSEMARDLIAIYPTLCHSLSLVYRRVPLQHPHFLLQHLHHRILCLTSADTPKIQCPKEAEVRVKSHGETRCIDQQKPKTLMKMKDAKKYRAIYCTTCRTDIKTLPVLLMNCQWSREQMVSGSTASTLTSRKIQIVISAWRRK